jgi:hypothetical protein
VKAQTNKKSRMKKCIKKRLAVKKDTKHKIRDDRVCYNKGNVGCDVIYRDIPEKGAGGGIQFW